MSHITARDEDALLTEHQATSNRRIDSSSNLIPSPRYDVCYSRLDEQRKAALILLKECAKRIYPDYATAKDIYTIKHQIGAAIMILEGE